MNVTTEKRSPRGSHGVAAACRLAMAVAALLVASVLGPATPAHAADVGPIGQPAGSGYRLECPPDHVLVAFNLASRLLPSGHIEFMGIAPRCARVQQGGTSFSIAGDLVSTAGGGIAGAFENPSADVRRQTAPCAAGSAVRALSLHTTQEVSLPLRVRGIALVCEYASGGTHTTSEVQVADGTPRGVETLGCPQGQWGAGIFGHHENQSPGDDVVITLGLICRPLPVAAAQPVQPQPQLPQLQLPQPQQPGGQACVEGPAGGRLCVDFGGIFGN